MAYMTCRQMEACFRAIAEFCYEEHGVNREETMRECRKNPKAVPVLYTTLTDEEVPVQTFVDVPGMRIIYCVEWEDGEYHIVYEDEYHDSLRFLGYLVDAEFDDFLLSQFTVERFLADGGFDRLPIFDSDK